MKKYQNLICLSLFALSVVGCGSTPKAVAKSTCDLAVTKKVDRAFIESKNALTNQSCWNGFDDHFDNLLEIAKGAPNKEHRRSFANFLEWSKDQGIISEVQFKKTYTRYFTPFFVSLPKHQSNCKVGQNLEKLTRDMDAEMLDKRKGLLQAMGSTKEFNKAKSDRDALLLIIAAAGEACKV